ncbi:MAG: hypothetical protein KDA89_17360, partial [Planctomycetaceae bacterium]|nr:hypothetical protein [Planctomycetaceae bacterium]
FDSTGWALEDFVALELAMQYAAEFDIGSEIDIAGTGDPWNPYEGLGFDVTAPSYSAKASRHASAGIMWQTD